MGAKRHNFRIECDLQCLLMGLDDVTYEAQLEDVSLGGASVRIRESATHGLHLGEMCGLILCNNPKQSPTKYTGRIVRLESGEVSISFGHQEHGHQNKNCLPDTAQPSDHLPIEELLVAHLWSVHNSTSSHFH